MKHIFILLVFIGLVLPGNLFAEFGQRMSVDDYDLHISATRLSSKLVVSGSVKGGDNAGLLKISVRIEDEDGYVEYVTGTIKNYRQSGRFSLKEKPTAETTGPSRTFAFQNINFSYGL